MAILHDSNEFFISFACYCFGKLWNWSDVIITPQGVKIYGVEYLDGPKIDFTEQVGIYYLHKADDDDLFACRGWIARSLGETLETHASNFFNGNRLRHMVIEIRLPKQIIGQDSFKARNINIRGGEKRKVA